MKLILKVVAPLAVLLAAATAAAAAPVDPTTPFPTVPADANVCKVEKLEVDKQQLIYTRDKRRYDRHVQEGAAGVGAAKALRAAERALHLTAIKLNDAKYAYSACRNEKGNDPKKVCITLALELNRLIDELAMRRELEALAKADYDALVAQNAAGAPVSRDDLEQAETDWKVAEIDRKQVEEKIVNQKAKIAAEPNCRGYQAERPVPAPPAPPAPPEPTSTTTPPTESPTSTTPAEPTSATSPVDSTSRVEPTTVTTAPAA